MVCIAKMIHISLIHSVTGGYALFLIPKDFEICKMYRITFVIKLLLSFGVIMRAVIQQS